VALGIPRSVAAFHLDKLAEVGVVDVRFERAGGRTGPGAGRPSKLYRPAQEEVVASVPDRHYDLAGSLLASAVADSANTGAPVRDCLRSAARTTGRQIGERIPVPLHRVLGDEVGGVFGSLHTDHGVTLRMGTGVTEIRGGDSVEAVELDDGRLEAADVVVIGVGVSPRAGLAEIADLPTDNGIVVDEHLETKVAGIFAAGDVANAWHPHYQRHLRVEHWANARNQGITAGRNAAGHRDSYARLPYFFSDQYDVGLEYVGHGSRDDAVIIRGDRDAHQFIAFWHREGMLTAAMSVNVWDVIDELKSIIETRSPIDLERLVDVDVPIAELARR
jgi:3-phenylpropionate/trans-cinnamate dioxygenase ferredoxin reductase subunit